MNIENAIKTFQIPNGLIPTDEYLKKRYRFIASKIHPDKFTNQGKKLRAHYDFLELQEAYSYLLLLDVNDRYIKTEIKINSNNNTTDFKTDIHETEYVEKKRPFEWILYSIFPGVILSLMFISIPTVVIIFFGIDVKDKSKSKIEYFGNLILYLIFGAIPMLFGFGVFLYMIFKKLESGNWFWWFIAIQILIANLYFGISYLKRKFFSPKLKSDILHKE